MVEADAMCDHCPHRLVNVSSDQGGAEVRMVQGRTEVKRQMSTEPHPIAVQYGGTYSTDIQYSIHAMVAIITMGNT